MKWNLSTLCKWKAFLIYLLPGVQMTPAFFKYTSKGGTVKSFHLLLVISTGKWNWIYWVLVISWFCLGQENYFCMWTWGLQKTTRHYILDNHFYFLTYSNIVTNSHLLNHIIVSFKSQNHPYCSVYHLPFNKSKVYSI